MLCQCNHEESVLTKTAEDIATSDNTPDCQFSMGLYHKQDVLSSNIELADHLAEH